MHSFQLLVSDLFMERHAVTDSIHSRFFHMYINRWGAFFFFQFVQKCTRRTRKSGPDSKAYELISSTIPQQTRSTSHSKERERLCGQVSWNLIHFQQQPEHELKDKLNIFRSCLSPMIFLSMFCYVFLQSSLKLKNESWEAWD